ncbi:MAG: serpin family protein [Desulfobacterales bacterium]|nr:serpin family protein [Desulfobacterales bacterium]
MKKQSLFITICLCGIMLNSAHADYASVNEHFDISFPCVEFEGRYYGMNITYEPLLSTRDRHYWRFQDGFSTNQGDDCTVLEDDYKLRISPAEFNGSLYRMTLNYRDVLDAPVGVYWELDYFFEVATSKKERETGQDFPGDDFFELLSSLSSFTLDFYHAVRDGSGENLFFSPYSISTAMAMTYAGARGETASQMATTLHYTLPDARLHPTFNYLDGLLASLADRNGNDEEGEFRLNITNFLWGQKGWAFLPDYLDVLAMHYGAGVGLLDFINAPEPSRVVINDWVADQTEGLITDLIPSGAIYDQTRFVLTNTIYFNAKWRHVFDEIDTAPGPFYLLDGSSINASMMSQTHFFPYAEGDNYQAVEMPYEGDMFSMVVLLPSEGEFENFENALDKAGLDAILAALDETYIDLKMPKFDYGSETLSLKTVLSNMGMPIAFTVAADFSGINDSAPLTIGDVLHKAFISVYEEGTTAGAATAVVGIQWGPPPEETEMYVNRPFIFFIREKNSGTILFFGRILQPE